MLTKSLPPQSVFLRINEIPMAESEKELPNADPFSTYLDILLILLINSGSQLFIHGTSIY